MTSYHFDKRVKVIPQLMKPHLCDWHCPHISKYEEGNCLLFETKLMWEEQDLVRCQKCCDKIASLTKLPDDGGLLDRTLFDRKLEIRYETLAKVLLKIRGPNDVCTSCTSGLCVVCKAYALLKGK